VFESFVGQWILDELEGKINNRQYGALCGRSTAHELVGILHHRHQALGNNSSVKVVFIDYAKAFDHIDHPTVLLELADLGVSHFLVRWVRSFLCHWQQRVKFLEYVFEWLTLQDGMPQSSYLWPLIFLVLVNDFSAGCLLHKFMDDSTLSEIIPKGDHSRMATIMTE